MTAFDKLYIFLQSRVVLLLLSLISLFVGIYGFFLIYSSGTISLNNSFQVSPTSPTPTINVEGSHFSPPTTIVVYVSGAIKNPGVYTLNESSRVSDLVHVAGGFTNSVDIDYLTTTLNLAEKLSDAQHFHFPWSGGISLSVNTNLPVDQSSSENSKVLATSDTVSTTTQKINLNNCSREELMSLKGIGNVYADRIISNRPINNYDELSSKIKLPASLVKYLTDNAVL